MNTWKKVALATLLMSIGAISPVIAADKNDSLSGNVSAVSTYVWRGLPQTIDAALQGGVDYSTAEGIHAGIWTSNVAAGSELDITIGFAGEAKGFGFDIGLIVYNFPQYEETAGPNEEYNFNEIYASISKDFLDASFYTSANAGSYIEINATFDKAVSDWDLGLHLGSYDVDQDFDGLAYAGGDNYNDYSVSLGKNMNGLDISFTLSGTSIDDDTYRTIVKVSKDF